MYMCIYIYTVCMQVSIAEKLQIYVATAPVAGLPQLLGCSATLRCRTLGRPLTSCGSQMFPDDFPNRISLDACTLGCSRWNTCPMHLSISFNMFKGSAAKKATRWTSAHSSCKSNSVNSEMMPSWSKLPHLLHRPSTHSSQLWVLHGATSQICQRIQRSFPVLQEVESWKLAPVLVEQKSTWFSLVKDPRTKKMVYIGIYWYILVHSDFCQPWPVASYLSLGSQRRPPFRGETSGRNWSFLEIFSVWSELWTTMIRLRRLMPPPHVHVQAPHASHLILCHGYTQNHWNTFMHIQTHNSHDSHDSHDSRDSHDVQWMFYECSMPPFRFFRIVRRPMSSRSFKQSIALWHPRPSLQLP